jgi:hypothetical protein
MTAVHIISRSMRRGTRPLVGRSPPLPQFILYLPLTSLDPGFSSFYGTIPVPRSHVELRSLRKIRHGPEGYGGQGKKSRPAESLSACESPGSCFWTSHRYLLYLRIIRVMNSVEIQVRNTARRMADEPTGKQMKQR